MILEWVVGSLAKIGWTKLARYALGALEKRADRLQGEQQERTKRRIAELDATVKLAEEGTERQKSKMSHPVFWAIILAALGPGVFTMWATALYNIFWHANGIWPQPWDIAAFQPQNLVWINKSIDWLFDPIGLGASVGTAWAAGRAVGSRR